MRPIRLAFLGLLVVGSAVIAVLSSQYFGDGRHSSFVIEKGRIPFESLFMFALRVHVVAAVWSLPACAILSSTWLLKGRPRIHRWLGRITGAVILLALVPSGAWLAFTAKGGAPSYAGFVLSGAIVAFATVQGVRRARAGDYVSHRRWNAHVLAQLSVAVTSRALLHFIDRVGYDPDRAYIVALWVPVLASAWLAHHLTAPKGKDARAWVRRFVIAPAGFASIIAVGFAGLGSPTALFEARMRWLGVPGALAAIRDDVLDPLAEQDQHHSRFSRGGSPASERRMRVTSDTSTADALGGAYLTFEIDERYGQNWESATYLGCVYPATGEVFLQAPRGYVRARTFFAHRDPEVAPAVCRPATPQDRS